MHPYFFKADRNVIAKLRQKSISTCLYPYHLKWVQNLEVSEEPMWIRIRCIIITASTLTLTKASNKYWVNFSVNSPKSCSNIKHNCKKYHEPIPKISLYKDEPSPETPQIIVLFIIVKLHMQAIPGLILQKLYQNAWTQRLQYLYHILKQHHK